MTKKIERFIFLLTVLVLPFNLGKHFVFNWSFVNGFLVDYLIPTIYVQDILIVILLALWLRRVTTEKITLQDLGWSSRILFLFIFAVFLSTISSINPLASITAFARLVLYAMFSLYVAYEIKRKKDVVEVVKYIMISVFFLELLAVGQWMNQGSVFNNYIFFGEQPYNFSSFGISKESFFGRTVVPVYGTFRHPNVFGGYLSITLLWILYFSEDFKSRFFKRFSAITIVFGSFVLLMTLSLAAFVSFITGLLLLLLFERFNVKKRFLVLVLLPPFVIAILLPLLTSTYFSEDPSFYRRVQLQDLTIVRVDDNALFGMGFNTSTQLSAEDFEYSFEVKQPQPVHNIFLLLLVESGMFSLIFLILFLAFALKYSPRFLFISFVQLIIIGLFDHYPITIHQTSLLLWLTVGIYLAYTLPNVQQT